jgi:hypothetical protein
VVALRTHVPLVDGEEAGVFLMAKEGKYDRSPGLHRIRAACGDILSSETDVQEEVFNFNSAMFQGPYVAITDPANDPVDSGVPFVPDYLAFPQLLDGLPQFYPEKCDGLKVSFTLAELVAAVLKAASNKAWMGCPICFTVPPCPSLALISFLPCPPWLSSGLLSVSLRRCVVRLVPKVPMVPTVVQLRPITLLFVKYV